MLGGDGDTFFYLSLKRLTRHETILGKIQAQGGGAGYTPNSNQPELNNIVDAWLCPSDFFNTVASQPGANTRAGANYAACHGDRFGQSTKDDFL